MNEWIRVLINTKGKNWHMPRTLYVCNVYDQVHVHVCIGFVNECAFDLIEIYKNLTVSRVFSHLKFVRWVCKRAPVYFLSSLRFYYYFVLFAFVFVLFKIHCFQLWAWAIFVVTLFFSLPWIRTYSVCALHIFNAFVFSLSPSLSI